MASRLSVGARANDLVSTLGKFTAWASVQPPASLENIVRLVLEWPAPRGTTMGQPVFTPAFVGALASWFPNLEDLECGSWHHTALPSDPEQLLGVVRGGLDRLPNLRYLELPDLSPLGVLQPLPAAATGRSSDISSSSSSSSSSRSGGGGGGLQSRLWKLDVRRAVAPMFSEQPQVFPRLTPGVAAGLASFSCLYMMELEGCFAHDDTASILQLLRHVPPSLRQLGLCADEGGYGTGRSFLQLVLGNGDLESVYFSGRLTGPPPRPTQPELPALGPLAEHVLVPYLRERLLLSLHAFSTRFLGLQAWASGPLQPPAAAGLLEGAELEAVREVEQRSHCTSLEVVCVSASTPAAWVQQAAEVLGPPHRILLQGGMPAHVDESLFTLSLPVRSAQRQPASPQQQQQQQQPGQDAGMQLEAVEAVREQQEQREQAQAREGDWPAPRALLTRAAARLLELPSAPAGPTLDSCSGADFMVLRGPLISGLLQSGLAGAGGWVSWLGEKAAELAPPSPDGELPHVAGDWKGLYQLLPDASALLLQPDGGASGAVMALHGAVHGVTPDAQLDARWVQAPGAGTHENDYSLPGPLVWCAQQEIYTALSAALEAEPVPPPPLL
ncbi:hypothetical protein HYH02_011668 [Chlamydomonas schloesseri]|uniref:Uncharacterized protein n=1 Tax=Chlamydomonas schloesseri TaxID=2026947 RepID=A0A835SZP3_9CHLO|nr:hypothetical protein HYH02_011668 [Chlamydomonas schloesseri]|eukprot:KAG2436164.1 hypothetical protein HYH02_011668 [Chlamydomonas schloesseri]